MSGWDHFKSQDPEATLSPHAKIIRLNQQLQQQLDEQLNKWTNVDDNVLGVHVRSTNLLPSESNGNKHEQLTAVDAERYVQQIKRTLRRHPSITDIHIASDFQPALDTITKEIGSYRGGLKIHSLEMERSADEGETKFDAPLESLKTAVLDAFLLARSEFKVLSSSSLSLFTVFHQGFNTPFFNVNEEDGYTLLRSVFPGRANSRVGEFPRRPFVDNPPVGTQMGEDQISAIQRALGPGGNLLVYGLGNDSPFWNDLTTGRVVFLEDDIPEEKNGVLWYDVVMQKYPWLEAYTVHYETETVNSYDRYIDSPERWGELKIKDLPESIRNEDWTVIVVDAPLGCCNAGPGRYQPIWESLVMAEAKGKDEVTHVFVDDFERVVEFNFAIAVYGDIVYTVVKREEPSPNEQAHFVLNGNGS